MDNKLYKGNEAIIWLLMTSESLERPMLILFDNSQNWSFDLTNA